MKRILDDLKADKKPKPGPQSGRRTVEPFGEAITLVGKASWQYSRSSITIVTQLTF